MDRRDPPFGTVTERQTNVPFEHRYAVTTEEFAAAIGISRAKAYQLVGSGAIPSVSIGRSRRILVSEVKKFIAARSS